MVERGKRFLIVAPVRSGGTMLSHLLDSHPDIYCHRGEPLHKHDPIRMACETPFQALSTVFLFHGYVWNGAKITYEQLNAIGIRSLLDLGVTHVVLLYRQNLLRLYVSEMIRKIDKANDLLPYTYQPRPKVTLTIDVDDAQTYMKQTETAFANIAKRLTNFNKTVLTYEDIVAYPRDVEHDLLQFFGLDFHLLSHRLVKRNPYPLSEIIDNYDTVKNSIDIRYKWMLNN